MVPTSVPTEFPRIRSLVLTFVNFRAHEIYFHVMRSSGLICNCSADIFASVIYCSLFWERFTRPMNSPGRKFRQEGRTRCFSEHGIRGAILRYTPNDTFKIVTSRGRRKIYINFVERDLEHGQGEKFTRESVLRIGERLDVLVLNNVCFARWSSIFHRADGTFAFSFIRDGSR